MISERLIFPMIKDYDEITLKNDKAFLDLLQVVLVGYFNLGMCYCKQGILEKSKDTFYQGYKMSKTFLEEGHYFT